MKETLIAFAIFAGIVGAIFLLPWAVATMGMSIRGAHSWYCESTGRELLDVRHEATGNYVPRCEMKVTTHTLNL